MSHTTYTTPAYVLSVRNIGEANRLFTLLTRDFGTLSATAQSIRLERSKLRFALQRFSFAEVSLVRGKGGWRITNAYYLSNIFLDKSSLHQRIVVDSTELLRRLVVGETPDENLFSIVSDGYMTLSALESKQLPAFELVFVSKILTTLGYGGETGILEEFDRESVSSESLRTLAEEKRPLIVKEINSALSSSGL
ncbi:MAG: recombination protein O N-terminal domain-containing protein [Candidatus Paceibacterota bacterium]